MQTINNPKQFKTELTKTTRIIFQAEQLRIEARKVHNKDSKRGIQLRYYHLKDNVWQPFSTFVSNAVVDCLADLDYQFKTFKLL